MLAAPIAAVLPGGLSELAAAAAAPSSLDSSSLISMLVVLSLLNLGLCISWFKITDEITQCCVYV